MKNLGCFLIQIGGTLQVSLLLDRQEFQQRVKIFSMSKGPAEHWLNTGLAKRVELQKALGSHLSGKDRYCCLLP